MNTWDQEDLLGTFTEEDEKLMDKYVDRFMNMSDYELEREILSLEKEVDKLYDQAEKAEDANNYWESSELYQLASDKADELKVAKMHKAYKEEQKEESKKELAMIDNELNKDLEANEEWDELDWDDNKDLEEDVDLGDIRLVRIPTGLKVVEESISEDFTGTPEERTDHLEYVDDDPTDGKFKLPKNITKKEDDQCKKYDLINHDPDDEKLLDESISADDYLNLEF